MTWPPAAVKNIGVEEGRETGEEIAGYRTNR